MSVKFLDSSPDKPFLLKPILERLGVSQRRLSFAVGIKIDEVSRYCRGTYKPSWPRLCRIAEALGVSLGVFLEGDPAHIAFFSGKKPQSRRKPK